MEMSVFRQGQPLERIDHLECIKIAAGPDAISMILHARLHHATVLVGLRSGEAVIKPHKETDEALRFEDLYDTAISLHDFNRMQKQRVRTREELAPHLFEIELLVIQERPVSIRVRLTAKSQLDVPDMIKRLVREDKEFGTELFSRYAAAMMEDDNGSIETLGPLRIADAAPEDAPDWEFVGKK